jgi:hypothetical protein
MIIPSKFLLENNHSLTTDKVNCGLLAGLIIRANIQDQLHEGCKEYYITGVIEYKIQYGVILRVVDESIKYNIPPIIPEYIKIFIPDNLCQYCDKTNFDIPDALLSDKEKIEIGYLWLIGNIHASTVAGYINQNKD